MSEDLELQNLISTYLEAREVHKMSCNQESSKGNEQRFQLMQNSDAKSFIKQKLDSGKWWIVILADEWAFKIARDIEQRYFLGVDERGKNKNDDLELFQGVDGVMSILMCRKVRLSAGQLARLLNRHIDLGAASKKALSKKSVISLSTTEILSHALQAGFLMWVQGKIPMSNQRRNPSVN